MKTVQERLASLYNRGTLYELALIRGETRYLVCYCDRSRSRVISAVRKPGRAEKLVELTGFSTFELATRAADGIRIGDWSIRLTGRTERQAIIEGELTFIMNVATAVSA